MFSILYIRTAFIYIDAIQCNENVILSKFRNCFVWSFVCTREINLINRKNVEVSISTAEWNSITKINYIFNAISYFKIALFDFGTVRIKVFHHNIDLFRSNKRTMNKIPHFMYSFTSRINERTNGVCRFMYSIQLRNIVFIFLLFRNEITSIW